MGSSRALLRIGVIALIALCLPAIVKTQTERISLAEIALIGVVAGLAGIALSSLLWNPKQFGAALWERIRYVVWVPIAVAATLLAFAIRIVSLLARVAIKLLVAAIGGILYLLFPIDLIPDIFVGPGQIDDALIIIFLTFWSISSALKDWVRSTFRILRPVTPFP